jgi:hypothetical protein
MKMILLIVLVLLLAAGVGFWLLEKKAPPAPTPLAATTTPNGMNAPKETTTNSSPIASTPTTNTSVTSAPDANAVAATGPNHTNAPPNTNAAPAVPTAPITVIYEDKFTQNGELNNAEPDTKNVKRNSWTATNGDGAYVIANGMASPTNGTYDAVFLPVNADSGVILDGKQNFTVSATIIPDKTNHWMGLGINKQVLLPHLNIFDSGLTNITLADGYADVFYNHNSIKYVTENSVGGKPHLVSMVYHAKSGNLTCSIDDRVLATVPVSAADIAALAAVSFGNGSAGPTSGVSRFELSVGGAD